MLPEAKLDVLLAHHASLEAELLGEVKSDRYVAITRELAELNPLIDAVKLYRAARTELADTEAMLADAGTDPEMRSLAEAELETLQARIGDLEQQIRIALLPKDAMDDRNVMLEIRAGTGGDDDDPVDAGLGGLLRVLGTGDVVEDETAVGVDGVDDLAGGAEARDDEGHLVGDDPLEVGLDALVGPVDDEVDAVGGGLRGTGIGGRCERLVDLGEPLLETFGRALVERGEGPEDPGAAGTDDELGPGGEEHRGGDDRQPEPALELHWERHVHTLPPGLASLPRGSGDGGGRRRDLGGA